MRLVIFIARVFLILFIARELIWVVSHIPSVIAKRELPLRFAAGCL
jgi:hypothetical protein